MPKIADIQPTPNPNARKFILKEPLTTGVARAYDSAQQAQGDTLAAALFAIDHVVNVYYSDRWLTVTQDGLADWNELLKQLAVPIRAAQASDLAPPPIARTDQALSLVDKLRLEQIDAVLNETIRPALTNDGGNVEIIGLHGNQLMVHYQGACGTCPSALGGTLAAIENQLRRLEPDIEVTAV